MENRKYKEALGTWESMLSRCNNKNDIGYKDYGGRGIFVCARWLSYRLFIQDMGYPPDDPLTGKRMTINRIDNDDGYYKDNCSWATKKEQRANQRIKKSVLETTVSPSIQFVIEIQDGLIKVKNRA